MVKLTSPVIPDLGSHCNNKCGRPVEYSGARRTNAHAIMKWGHLTQRNRSLVAANTCFQRILKNARLLPVAIYVKEPNWIAEVSSPAPAPVYS